MKFEPIIGPGFGSRAEMEETAIRMRRVGYSRKQIAEALGFKTGGKTLSEWLRAVPPPEWTRRPNAKDELREKAVAMRLDGRSYREIQQETGVAKSTLSQWLKDVPLTDEQRQSLYLRKVANGARRGAANRAISQATKLRTIREAFSQVQDLSESELFVAGVVAYQAEGAKEKPWSSGQQVKFMNSDPGMILLFIRWLELLGYGRGDLTFRLSIHKSADEQRALRFWSDVLAVPVGSFKKTTFKRHNPKTLRRNTGERYHGCLVVTVRRSSRLNRQISGWFFGLVSIMLGDRDQPWLESARNPTN